MHILETYIIYVIYIYVRNTAERAIHNFDSQPYMPMLHSKHPSRSQVLPSVRILRDLRHIVANVKKIPVSISHGIHFAKYLAGCVTFSSTLASQALFSSYWSATLSDFLLAGHGRMVQYLQTEVLMFDPKTNCWTASWWCGFTAMCPPGYSPNTVFQGVERFNATIKSGFPNLDTAHYLTLPDAAEKACASLLANARKKGWSEDGWVPHARTRNLAASSCTENGTRLKDWITCRICRWRSQVLRGTLPPCPATCAAARFLLKCHRPLAPAWQLVSRQEPTRWALTAWMPALTQRPTTPFWSCTWPKLKKSVTKCSTSLSSWHQMNDTPRATDFISKSYELLQRKYAKSFGVISPTIKGLHALCTCNLVGILDLIYVSTACISTHTHTWKTVCRMESSLVYHSGLSFLPILWHLEMKSQKGLAQRDWDTDQEIEL